MGGPPDNNDTGAAWVLTRSGGAWTQQGPNWSARAVPPVPKAGLSRCPATVWTQQGSKLVGTGFVYTSASGIRQGNSVALSADGNTAIVGGPEDYPFGAAWVYTRSAGVWTQQGSKLVGTGAVERTEQGSSVALSGDGNTAIVGGLQDNSYTGAAWVYTRSGNGWTQQPAPLSIADRLRLTRSPTFDNRDYVAASAPSKSSVDLHEVYFQFNSAEIAAEAEPQLRELGAALSDPRLKGSTISIGGHTDAVGGDAFNQRLSERRAATIKWYLADNFRLPAANLHAVGYGKQRPKNKADLFAPENRRVEIVNETARTQAQR